MATAAGLGTALSEQPTTPQTSASAAQSSANISKADCAKAKALETRAYQTKSLADFRVAATALEKCSQKYPDDLKLHQSLGYIYLDKLNEPGKAFPHLTAVYTATPAAPGWGQMLAEDAGKLGQTNLQIQVLTNVASLSPHDPWCRLDLAKALVKAGRYSEADAAYRDALKIAPDDQWINISYAKFLEAHRRSLEAERIAQRMVTAHQNSAPALNLLGDIYQDNSDFAGAQAQYARALLANPGDADAKAGLEALRVQKEPQLKSSAYVFHGTDHFFQSEVYNTITVPVQDRMLLHASFNAGFFSNDRTVYPDVERYEEELGLNYIVNDTLSFDADASAFEVNSQTLAGFGFSGTWAPTANFWAYGSYHFHDPVTDSIETTADGLGQNVGSLNVGYQITEDLSATLNSSRANYSDGNTRNFIHIEPATYTFWHPIQLQAGPVYEVLDYGHQTSNYGSPSWYQIVGPMIQIEPQINDWLSIKARAEAAYVARGSAWGTIILAGPSVHFNKAFNLTAQFLYYDLPGSYTDYSGLGFQAALNWRF